VQGRHERAAARLADRHSILEALRAMVAAWNRRDAAAFGGAFGSSGSYVTGAGQEFRGRDAIRGLVKQATANVQITSVRVQCRGPLGLADVHWSATSGRGARQGVMACVLSREGEKWLIQKLVNEERTMPRGRPTRG
jgi:uncharacterized protein (TIGR02246 family)